LEFLLIKKFLYRWLLPKLIAKSGDARIPPAGRNGEAVNCYVVALDRNDSPFFVATSIEVDEISGFKWKENKYSDRFIVLISDLNKGSINITHFYGIYDVFFDSIYSADWHYVTRLIYLKIHLYSYIENTFQYFFNRISLSQRRE
jgi:hypothetical protein